MMHATYTSMKSASDMINMVELLQMRADVQADETAYTFLHTGTPQPETITYKQLAQKARSIAVHLYERGAANQRVLLLYPPGLDYIAAFWGCLYAGAVAVPAYPPDPLRLRQTLMRLLVIVRDAKPQVILTTDAIFEIAKNTQSAFPKELQDLSWLITNTPTNDRADEWQRPLINKEDMAFLQYTSGSTSIPKGVMVSHGNLLHNLAYLNQAFQLSAENDASLSWLPHIHDMGLIDGILHPLYVGCPAYLMSPLVFIQRPFRWLEAITNYRITHTGAPNFAYELCVRKVKPEQVAELDLHRWETAYNGAEPLRANTLYQFAQTFAPAGFSLQRLYPCYGLAESTLMVSGSNELDERPAVVAFDTHALGQKQVIPIAPDHPAAHVLVGCGQTIMDDTEIAIVDPDSCQRCAPDKIGEIWVSGPSVAQGYWQRPEETKKTFAAYITGTGEGPFMRTGDLGFIYAGNLFIAGRIKDLIILNGRNYYPQDIEETVDNCHQAVRPGCSAAFSVDRDDKECLIIVAEVRTKKEEESEEAVKNQLDQLARLIKRTVLQDFEIMPDRVIFLQPHAIPKTSSGKIQRHACHAEYLHNQLKVLYDPQKP